MIICRPLRSDWLRCTEAPRTRLISNKSAEQNAAHSSPNTYNCEHRREIVAVNNAAAAAVAAVDGESQRNR